MVFKSNSSSTTKTSIITALITCFNPNYKELNRLIESIKNQVNYIVLINNGGLDEGQIFQKNVPNLLFLNPKANLGTAGGYNLGSIKAWEIQSTHILLLDQDSECDKSMLQELIFLENFLLQNGQKIAALGPYYICKSNMKPAPFIQHQGFKISRIFKESFSVQSYSQNKNYAPCSYLISSGSLISKKSWEIIGSKNENLFLDFTDIEWGLRAKSLGYTCYGSFDAKMFHLIGDQQLNILGRKISLHSPLRHYYAFRNCIWLFKQKYIPFGTRVNYLTKLVPKILIYSFFSAQPWEQFKFMIMGIYHGIKNKMGIYCK